MADNFTPITLNSQEEVNKFFGDRAKQARNAARAELEQEYKDRYAGFDEFKAKAEKYDTEVKALNDTITALRGEKDSSANTISELQGKIREYEINSAKMRIAREAGLPAELADRLTGADEDAMRTDAESLAKLIQRNNVAPMYNRDNGAGDAKDDALKNLLKRVREQ